MEREGEGVQGGGRGERGSVPSFKGADTIHEDSTLAT